MGVIDSKYPQELESSFFELFLFIIVDFQFQSSIFPCALKINGAKQTLRTLIRTTTLNCLFIFLV